MKTKLLSLLAITLVFTMMALGCDNGSGGSDPQAVTYQSTDDGITYILTITKNTSRAAYEAAVGDYYVLVIKTNGQPDKVSEGEISYIDSVTFTLKPKADDADLPTFSVTITESGGQITKIEGTITLKDGTSVTGSGAITSGGNNNNGGNSGGLPTAKGKMTINGFPSDFENMYAYPSGYLTNVIYILGFNDVTISNSDFTLKLVKITNGTAVVPLYTFNNAPGSDINKAFNAYDGNDSISLGIMVFEFPELSPNNMSSMVDFKDIMTVAPATFSNGNLTVTWEGILHVYNEQ